MFSRFRRSLAPIEPETATGGDSVQAANVPLVQQGGEPTSIENVRDELADLCMDIAQFAKDRSEGGDLRARMLVWMPLYMGWVDREEAAEWLGGVARDMHGTEPQHAREEAQGLLTRAASLEIAARPYPGLVDRVWKLTNDYIRERLGPRSGGVDPET